MRTSSRVALGAALLLLAAGCSITIDPAGVHAPEAKKPRPPPRGACVSAADGHKLCGDSVGPAGRATAPAGHGVRGGVAAAAAPASSPQHRIAQGAVTP